MQCRDDTRAVSCPKSKPSIRGGLVIYSCLAADGEEPYPERKVLPLDEETARHLPRLPRLHKDPFDRMLVCHALIHGLVILTPDDLVTRYPVRTEW